MTYPPGGNAGWEELDVVTTDPPVSYPLPIPFIADYYDPAPLGGVGGIRPAVVVSVGASSVVVRGSLEARFTWPEVWGVALLDSIGVFNGPCALILTVFDDDRVTPLFQVGTDPTHPFPYLVNPENYGEQEVDFAAGAASIGTVSVAIIDKPLTAGDQDSGRMTGWLARNGFANIAGRRCLLERFINVTLGNQVIIDGPAGNPTMEPDYASYRFEIRDVRDAERSVRLFESAGSAATGLRSLVPDELIDGYGYDGPSNTYLIRPAIPLQGHVTRVGGYPMPPEMSIAVDAGEFPDQERRTLISMDVYQAIIEGIGRPEGYPVPEINFVFQWRIAGTSDPWTEIPGAVMGISLDTDPSTITDNTRLITQITIEDRRLDPLYPDYDPAAVDLPATDEIIEFFLLGELPTTEQHPVVLDSRLVPGVLGPLSATGAVLTGRWHLVASIGGISSGTIDLLTDPGNPDESTRRQTVPVFNRLGNESVTPDIFIPTRGTFSWGPTGGGLSTSIVLDPPTPFAPSALAYIELPMRTTDRVFTKVQLAANDADVPTDGELIDFTILYQPGAPELSAITVGPTAGEVAKNVYDGIYSPRDQNGQYVPMRVRYDPAALALMTDPVRVRITEPVEDARDWLERMVFAPTGWVPALDQQGRISPMSQVAPSDTTGLPGVVNDFTEAAPSWDAGQKIINVVRFMYNRDYVLADTDPGAYPEAPPSGTPDPDKQRQKLVQVQPVLLEFRDQASVDRNGEQILEIDGSLFTAIGVVDTGSTVTPSVFTVRRIRTRFRTVTVVTGGGQMRLYGPNAVVNTATPVIRTAAHASPVGGVLENETGYLMFWARQTSLLPRYALGAPTVTVNVRRSVFSTLRAGSWVVLDLSWFPDYITGRRGLITLAQVLSLGDLDCAWRRIVAEVVVPPGSVSS